MALYLLKYVSQFLECSVRSAIMVQGVAGVVKCLIKDSEEVSEVTLKRRPRWIKVGYR